MGQDTGKESKPDSHTLCCIEKNISKLPDSSKSLNPQNLVSGTVVNYPKQNTPKMIIFLQGSKLVFHNIQSTLGPEQNLFGKYPAACHTLKLIGAGGVQTWKGEWIHTDERYSDWRPQPQPVTVHYIISQVVW